MNDIFIIPVNNLIRPSCIVDSNDTDKVMSKKWRVDYSPTKNKKSKYYFIVTTNEPKLRLSRFIVDCFDKGMIVDHINGNTFDNRRSNLRICEHYQNCRNQLTRAKDNRTSKFKGVSFIKYYQKYRAYVCANYKTIHLGYFDTELEAAKAYNDSVKKYHGEFAALNVL